MKRQIPRGPDDLICPLHKAVMETVCHKCPFWQEIAGKHPQTGESLNQWNCAIAFLPMLLLNAAHEVRGGAAETEALRNEIAVRSDAANAQRIAYRRYDANA